MATQVQLNSRWHRVINNSPESLMLGNRSNRRIADSFGTQTYTQCIHELEGELQEARLVEIARENPAFHDTVQQLEREHLSFDEIQSADVDEIWDHVQRQVKNPPMISVRQYSVMYCLLCTKCLYFALCVLCDTHDFVQAFADFYNTNIGRSVAGKDEMVLWEYDAHCHSTTILSPPTLPPHF